MDEQTIHIWAAATPLGRQVRDFFALAGQHVPDHVGIPDIGELSLRVNLVTEEFCEVLTAALGDRFNHAYPVNTQ